ncbi:hypothetical protein OF83DRAFT_1173022 [Amylostereum chailletii]|nr:hypothetical protein OF83DRAFT_1173022 [Amylostereum chailletii]
MWSSPANPTPQLNTVLVWYKAVSSWDIAALTTLLSENYVHHTLPASANDPPKNKTEGLAHARKMGEIFGNKPMNYEIYDVNEAEGKIWVHSKLSIEVPSGPSFNNESIFIFTIDPATPGEIAIIKEFVDTKMMHDMKSGSG